MSRYAHQAMYTVDDVTNLLKPIHNAIVLLLTVQEQRSNMTMKEENEE